MLLVALLSCADNWRHANIQLDLSNAPWQRESRIRSCIDKQQSHESAVQAGRIAIDFLSYPLNATIQLLPPIEAGNTVIYQIEQAFNQDGYYSAQWESCDLIECVPCETDALSDSGPILLAIRLNTADFSE